MLRKSRCVHIVLETHLYLFILSPGKGLVKVPLSDLVAVQHGEHEPTFDDYNFFPRLNLRTAAPGIGIFGVILTLRRWNQ